MLLPDSPHPHLKASVLSDMKIQKFTINYTEGSDTVAIPKSCCLLIKFLQMLRTTEKVPLNAGALAGFH